MIDETRIRLWPGSLVSAVVAGATGLLLTVGSTGVGRTSGIGLLLVAAWAAWPRRVPTGLALVEVMLRRSVRSWWALMAIQPLVALPLVFQGAAWARGEPVDLGVVGVCVMIPGVFVTIGVLAARGWRSRVAAVRAALAEHPGRVRRIVVRRPAYIWPMRAGVTVMLSDRVGVQLMGNGLQQRLVARWLRRRCPGAATMEQ